MRSAWITIQPWLLSQWPFCRGHSRQCTAVLTVQETVIYHDKNRKLNGQKRRGISATALVRIVTIKDGRAHLRPERALLGAGVGGVAYFMTRTKAVAEIPLQFW
jgi:hypothetical protein